MEPSTSAPAEEGGEQLERPHAASGDLDGAAPGASTLGDRRGAAAPPLEDGTGPPRCSRSGGQMERPRAALGGPRGTAPEAPPQRGTNRAPARRPRCSPLGDGWGGPAALLEDGTGSLRCSRRGTPGPEPLSEGSSPRRSPLSGDAADTWSPLRQTPPPSKGVPAPSPFSAAERPLRRLPNSVLHLRDVSPPPRLHG